nr:hypothetical protein [Tanacetum cinerariifolium]
MDIDQELNPNPNSTLSPPNTIESSLPPIAPIPTPAIPPIAPIPHPPIRPINGETAKKDDSDDDDSGPEYEVSEESRLFREKQEKAKADFLMKQRAAALAVPTNDKAVRSRLRRLGEPVTLFGEREMDRRDRLRMIMARLDAEGQLETLMRVLEEEEGAGMEDGAGGGEDEGEAIQYPFYTEGSTALLKARYWIAKESVLKAAVRLGRAKRKRDDPDEDLDAEINWALENAKSFDMDCSEIGDDRPLSGCSFSADGKFLATWYGNVLFQEIG